MQILLKRCRGRKIILVRVDMVLVNGTNGLLYASTPPRLDSSPSPCSPLRDVLVVKGSVVMMEGVRSVKKNLCDLLAVSGLTSHRVHEGLRLSHCSISERLRALARTSGNIPEDFFFAAPLRACRPDFTATVTSVSENAGDASKTPKFIKLPCRNIKLELLTTHFICILFFCCLWLLWYL